MEILAGAIIAAPFVIAAWLRFEKRRRALEKLVEKRTTSRKLRVDREI